MKSDANTSDSKNGVRHQRALSPRLSMMMMKLLKRFSKHKSLTKSTSRLTHTHNEENVTTVKELVAPLRQEGQKQTHRSTSHADIQRNRSNAV